MLSLIAAMARNRTIGVDGNMPWHIPSELRHFRDVTMGKTLLMGRKTYQAIGGPLPGRNIIVISSRMHCLAEGVTVCRSLEQALAQAAEKDMELMVAGGESLYLQTIAFAHRVYLTILDREYEGDARFPAFEKKEYRETVLKKVPAVLEKGFPGYTCYLYEKR